MTNPFDDPDSTFYVLVNAAGQHSLWPGFAPVPPGWRAVQGPDGRDRCLEHIERNWTDPAAVGSDPGRRRSVGGG